MNLQKCSFVGELRLEEGAADLVTDDGLATCSTIKEAREASRRRSRLWHKAAMARVSFVLIVGGVDRVHDTSGWSERTKCSDIRRAGGGPLDACNIPSFSKLPNKRRNSILRATRFPSDLAPQPAIFGSLCWRLNAATRNPRPAKYDWISFSG